MIGFTEHLQIIITSNCSTVTPCLAGPPFLVSPQQIECEFLSTHFSVWGTGESYRGLNPVNWGEVLEHWNALFG
jgi:hypothetical protein